MSSGILDQPAGTATVAPKPQPPAGMAVPVHQPYRGRPAELRGSLYIKDHIFYRVAQRAATSVADVVPASSLWRKVVRGEYPRIDIQVAGERIRVDIQLAVTWPTNVALVARTVSERVADELTRVTGYFVDGVDVHVAQLVRPGQNAGNNIRRVE